MDFNSIINLKYEIYITTLELIKCGFSELWTAWVLTWEGIYWLACQALASFLHCTLRGELALRKAELECRLRLSLQSPRLSECYLRDGEESGSITLGTGPRESKPVCCSPVFMVHYSEIWSQQCPAGERQCFTHPQRRTNVCLMQEDSWGYTSA